MRQAQALDSLCKREYAGHAGGVVSDKLMSLFKHVLHERIAGTVLMRVKLAVQTPNFSVGLVQVGDVVSCQHALRRSFCLYEHCVVDHSPVDAYHALFERTDTIDDARHFRFARPGRGQLHARQLQTRSRCHCWVHFPQNTLARHTIAPHTHDTSGIPRTC